MGVLPMLMPRSVDPQTTRRIDRLDWRAGACFEAQGVRIGVRSNDLGLMDALPLALPPDWRETPSPEVARLYSVWVGARPGGGCRIYEGASRIARVPDSARALLALESEIRRFVAASAPDRIFVHAGVVGWKGRAILVPGTSRSGKTTLVAALVQAGASYLSDEFAPLDERGRAHPFAKPLTIRGPGGCDLHARRRPVEDLGGCRAPGPLPVGLVAFTEFRAGREWEPSVLTPGCGLLRMLEHTVPVRLRPDAALRVLERTVAGALLLAGPRGEAGATAECLLQALAERPAVGSAAERGAP